MGAIGQGPEQACPWPNRHLGPGQASHPVLAVLEGRVGCPAELQQLGVRLAPRWGPLARHGHQWDGLAWIHLAEGLGVTGQAVSGLGGQHLDVVLACLVAFAEVEEQRHDERQEQED